MQCKYKQHWFFRNKAPCTSVGRINMCAFHQGYLLLSLLWQSQVNKFKWRKCNAHEVGGKCHHRPLFACPLHTLQTAFLAAARASGKLSHLSLSHWKAIKVFGLNFCMHFKHAIGMWRQNIRIEFFLSGFFPASPAFLCWYFNLKSLT